MCKKKFFSKKKNFSKMTYKINVCVSLLMLASVLTGCGGGGGSGSGDFMAAVKSALKLEPTKVWLQKVYFEVDDKLNNDAPVTVDVLIVYNEALLQEISKLSASQYFAKKDQIKRDGAENIDIYTFDIVPGQTLAPQPIKPNHVTGQGALVFARYASKGEHRQAIGTDREVTLEMGPKDFKVIPVKHPNDD